MTTIAIPRLLRRHRPPLGLTWLKRLRTAATWFRRALCGLDGHEFLTHHEPGRLYLECGRCGRQTPGWLLQTRPAKAEGTRRPAGGERGN